MKKSIAAGLLIFGATAAHSQTYIRIATEAAFPPFNFVNDDGQIDGFERAVGDEVCARAQIECEWVINAWDSIIPNLVAGNYDVVMAGMSNTPERDAIIDFSDDYFPPAPSAYVGLAKTGMEALEGSVAAQTGTVHADFVAESGATLVEYATADETISALRNGQVDTVLAGVNFLDEIVTSSNGELEFLGDPLAIGGGVGIGLRESDLELKTKLNSAISSLKEDGTLRALIAEWFDGKSAY